MAIDYPDKIPVKDILANTRPAQLECLSDPTLAGRLIHSDNLAALKALMTNYRGAVDLVYIDPPFATNTDFTVSGQRRQTVSRSSSGTLAYQDKLTGSGYLEFLRQRLVFCANCYLRQVQSICT